MPDSPTLDLAFPYVAELEALWRWTRRQPWFQQQHDLALADFMGQTVAPQTNDAVRHHALRFLEWFHFDRVVPVTGATPLAGWVAEGGLPADHALGRSVVGAFRVKRTVPHRQAVLEGLRDGASYRVADKPLSVALKPDQLAFGRVFPHGKGWVVAGPMIAVAAEIALALQPEATLAAIADGLALERAVFTRPG